MTVRILHGHVIDALRSLDPDSVQCVITSVPYWGLRSYKTEHQVWGGNPRCDHFLRGARDEPSPFCLFCGAWKGEHGLEPSLTLWLDHEVLIWREIRRVLRKDGLAWLNIGDSYAGGGRGQDSNSTLEGSRDNQAESRVAVRSRTGSHGLKAKQRLLLPARLAIALQDDGWWIRDEIIWHKSNPMPSSVDDRTTPAHETIFLLAKRARYFSDFSAIAEPFSEASLVRLSQNVEGQNGGAKQEQYDIEGMNDGFQRPADIVKSVAEVAGWGRGDEPRTSLELNTGSRRGHGASGNKARVLGDERGNPGSPHRGASIPWAGITRNKRSVWTIPTEAFPDAHFATFPTRLVEPMILAATSARGACTRCGAPWERVKLSEFQIQRDVAPEKALRGHEGQKPMDDTSRFTGTPRGRNLTLTAGWYPRCGCDGLPKLPSLPPAKMKDERRLVLEQRRELCEQAASIRTRPCVVLDPFFGSGTVGLVADKAEPPRDCIGIELNGSYVEIARQRIAPLLVTVSGVPERVDLAREHGAS